jgi:hypothetical protein
MILTLKIIFVYGFSLRQIFQGQIHANKVPRELTTTSQKTPNTDTQGICSIEHFICQSSVNHRCRGFIYINIGCSMRSALTVL